MVPRLVKNTQISVTDTLSKTSLCLIRIKISRQFEPGNLFWGVYKSLEANYTSVG